jgi:hypothetical protein
MMSMRQRGVERRGEAWRGVERLHINIIDLEDDKENQDSVGKDGETLPSRIYPKVLR